MELGAFSVGPVRPGDERALRAGVVGRAQHQGPVVAAGPALPQAAGRHRPDDLLQVLEDEVSQEAMAKLFAHLHEMLGVRDGGQLAGEVLDVQEHPLAGARRAGVAVLINEEAANPQALALHLVADAGWIGKVHVRVAWVPALRLEIGELPQGKRHRLLRRRPDRDLHVDGLVLEALAGGKFIRSGRKIDLCAVVDQSG
jgi:hypothetical protein